MARTTFVKSARKRKEGKAPYNCYTCHQSIEEGQSYYWNQPSRYSNRFNWHATCERPRPSVLETNEKRAMGMAAFEDAYDALERIDVSDYEGDDASDTLLEDLKQIVSDCKEAVMEAAEAWRESAQAIEDGFGHETEQSAEQNEHGDTYESAADELDNIADDIEAYEEDQWGEWSEWAESAVASVSEGLGSAEGTLD